MNDKPILTIQEKEIIQAFLTAVLKAECGSIEEIDGFEFHHREHFFEVLWSYGLHNFILPKLETYDSFIIYVRDNGDIIFEIFVPTEMDENTGVSITLDVYRSREPVAVVGASCHW